MIEEISLQQPHSLDNWGDPKSLELFKIIIEKFKIDLTEFINRIEKGEVVYVKVINPPDYRDSVAKVSIVDEPFTIFVGGYHYKAVDTFRYQQGSAQKYFKPRLTWDGLKNKIHPHLSDLIWLKGYEGPTILKKFDAKAAKKELLNNYKFKDLDGTILKVGDEVLYINARYGGGMQLNYGIVDRFEASIGADRQEVFTIVKNLTGEESKISNSETFIKKLK